MTASVKEIKIETEVGAKGRILFPAIIRNELQLKVGTRVIIELKDHKLLVYRAVPLIEHE